MAILKPLRKCAEKWLAFAAVALSVGTASIARADEFTGKLQGWVDASSFTGADGQSLRANGQDNSDDTMALQKAFDVLSTSVSPTGKKVLYIPNGTYYINQTLLLQHKSGVSIFGQSKSGVRIVWRGPVGGTMVVAQGNWFSRYGRITWDGAGTAGIIWQDLFKGQDGQNNNNSVDPGSYAPTHNEHADEVFKNAQYGIRVGGKDVVMVNGSQHYNQMDAETPILRCQFLDLSTAGISIEDPNALDWFIWYGDFRRCGRAVTTAPTDEHVSGGGNFHIYNSKFLNSTKADIYIGHTNYFSFRGNYSTGSPRFLETEWYGSNTASIELQNNKVVNCGLPVIKVQNAGPLTLIDNQFHSSASSGTMVEVGVGNRKVESGVGPDSGTDENSADDTISIGNKFSLASHIKYSGRMRSIGDTSGATPISTQDPHPALPGELPTAPSSRVYELSALSRGATGGTAIQKAINWIHINHRTRNRPILHIPVGTYNVAQTITIPAGCDVQLVGDGFLFATNLKWTGTGAGPTLKMSAPSRATLRDLNLGGSAEGLVIETSGQKGDRVFMEQANFSGKSKGLLAKGSKTRVEMHNSYPSDTRNAAGNAVAVNASDGARINLFGGCLTTNNLNFDVQNNGNILAQDFWFETGANSSSGPRFMSLNGASKGTITLQNFLASPVTQTGVPAIDIDGFQGRLNVLGMTGVPGYSSAPFTLAVTGNTTRSASIMIMGSTAGRGNTQQSTWIINKSSTAQVKLLSNKGGYPHPWLNDQWTGTNGFIMDDGFIAASLTDIRGQLPTTLLAAPALAPNVSDVRLYRVCVDGGSTAILVAPVTPIHKVVPTANSGADRVLDTREAQP